MTISTRKPLPLHAQPARKRCSICGETTARTLTTSKGESMPESVYVYRGVTIRQQSTFAGGKAQHRWAAIVTAAGAGVRTVLNESRSGLEREIDALFKQGWLEMRRPGAGA